MEFQRITDTSHPHWERAWALYEQSFPLWEQRSLAQHVEAMKDPAFHAEIVMDSDKFVGILFYWKWDGFRFVEHLATDPSVRGGGYGARILSMLDKEQRKESEKPVETAAEMVTLLEIDPPQDDISVRREKFYQRAGYLTNPYKHVHPSFRPSTPAHDLLIMSSPRAVTPGEFAGFRRFMFDIILKYSDLDPAAMMAAEK